MPTSSATAAKGTRHRACARGRREAQDARRRSRGALNRRRAACGTMHEEMVPEAPLREDGRRRSVPRVDGWFVLNARDAPAGGPREGPRSVLRLRGGAAFPQIGSSLVSLAPGEPMSSTTREDDQEDFLVLSGEALLLVGGRAEALGQCGLRPLPREDESRYPRRRCRLVPRARGGSPLRVDRTELGRLPGRRDRTPARRRRRGGAPPIPASRTRDSRPRASRLRIGEAGCPSRGPESPSARRRSRRGRPLRIASTDRNRPASRARTASDRRPGRARSRCGRRRYRAGAFPGSRTRARARARRRLPGRRWQR